MGNVTGNCEEAEEKSQASDFRILEHNLYALVMRKEDADLIKAEFSGETLIESLGKYVELPGIERDKQVLGFLHHHLELNISDYSLDEICTLWDEDRKNVVGVYWFSRGMEDTYFCITPDGQIPAMDPDAPMHLLAQVSTTLGNLLEE